MKNILILTNSNKDADHKVTHRLYSLFRERGVECVLCDDPEENFAAVRESAGMFDLAVVIGGDGSFIRAARTLTYEDFPILGVNMGTLGYLTEVEVNELEGAVAQLCRGDYEIENRMMLSGRTSAGEEAVALNDIVVTRKGGLRVIYFDIFVNGELLNSYQADGIVISTPTGSTAYNLSAGGPIVKPTAAVILVTPICSHALYKSGIVLPPDDEVVIRISEGKNSSVEEAAVTFDGADIYTLKTGDEVRISRAKAETRILKLDRVSFLDTLRSKMKGS